MDITNIKEKFSLDIQGILENSIWEKNTEGKSGSEVYKIICNNGEIYYLKIQQKNLNNNLKNEKNNYSWLKDKMKVPQILSYIEDENLELMLMNIIEGVPASDNRLNYSNEEIIVMIAKELRKLHSIDIGECSIISNVDRLLKIAESRVEKNLVDELGFDCDHMGKDPKDILNELKNTKQNKEDLVFIHGDYCLSNIILKNGIVNGLIDMEYGGVGDRYRDLALVYRSIKYNMEKEELFDLFLKEYGLKQIDMEKIKYHILLDELL